MNTEEEEEIQRCRQAAGLCDNEVAQHQVKVDVMAFDNIRNLCMQTSCNSLCRFSLDKINKDISCCIAWLDTVKKVIKFCNIIPPKIYKWNSASSASANIFVITLISAICYFMK